MHTVTGLGYSVDDWKGPYLLLWWDTSQGRQWPLGTSIGQHHSSTAFWLWTVAVGLNSAHLPEPCNSILGEHLRGQRNTRTSIEIQPVTTLHCLSPSMPHAWPTAGWTHSSVTCRGRCEHCDCARLGQKCLVSHLLPLHAGALGQRPTFHTQGGNEWLKPYAP